MKTYKIKIQKQVLILLVLISLLFLTSSCKKDDDHSTNITTSLSEKEGYLVDNSSSISYEYKENLKIMDYKGVKYYYFNDNAFFMVKEGEKKFDSLSEDKIDSFFKSAKKDFSKKSWSNCVVTKDAKKIDIPSIEGWEMEISMTYEKEINYKGNIILIYSNNSIISFTFLGTEKEYDENLEDFSDILNSIKPL